MEWVGSDVGEPTGELADGVTSEDEDGLPVVGGRKADGAPLPANADMGGRPGIPAKPGRPKGRKNGKFLAAASMLAAKARGLLSKLKRLCFKSLLAVEEADVGVCGGVSRGVATSAQTAADVEPVDCRVRDESPDKGMMDERESNCLPLVCEKAKCC